MHLRRRRRPLRCHGQPTKQLAEAVPAAAGLATETRRAPRRCLQSQIPPPGRIPSLLLCGSNLPANHMRRRIPSRRRVKTRPVRLVKRHGRSLKLCTRLFSRRSSPNFVVRNPVAVREVGVKQARREEATLVPMVLPLVPAQLLPSPPPARRATKHPPPSVALPVPGPPLPALAKAAFLRARHHNHRQPIPQSVPRSTERPGTSVKPRSQAAQASRVAMLAQKHLL